MADSLKRLLVLSWALPPLLTPRSLQVGRLLHALFALGWHSDVVCVDPDSLPGLRRDHYIAEKYLERLKVHREPASKLRMLRMALGRLHPALRPLPDPERGWQARAAQRGKQMAAQNEYQALVSFAQPWSSHLAALDVQKATGLPWLAHFSDPWADNPYYVGLSVGQKEIMHDFEAQVVEQADQLVFTNQPTAEAFVARYGAAIGGKSAVIPHGYDYLMKPEATAVQPGDVLHLVYTGSLYGLRNPAPLIRALQSLPSPSAVRVSFAGPAREKSSYIRLAADLGVADRLDFVGDLDYRSSLELAASADVLLLIDAPSVGESLFLPSKLVDYLMFNKPILGITPSRGASANLLKRLGSQQASPEDLEGITRELSQLVEAKQRGQLTVAANFEQVAGEYRIDRLAIDFAKIIRSLSSEGAG